MSCTRIGRGTIETWLAASALVFAAACGSSAQPAQSSPSAASTIAGAAQCPAAQAQDLTFTGALTGHIQCSTTGATCGQARTIYPNGVSVDIGASLGANKLEILIAFDPGDPGTYAAGTLGDSGASSLVGATIDGDGHWTTPPSGGSMTVTANDSNAASGSIDITLVKGAESARVSGTWRCVKTSS